MKYEKKVILKNGKELLLRSGTEDDGEAVLNLFNQTHAESDFLLTYPDENSFTEEIEREFLKNKEESGNEVEILAFLDGRLVGSAGIEQVGSKDKIKHRAEFGISTLKDYWGLGIGRAMMNACIECAKKAGYYQIELTAVAENERAVNMYKSAGFEEFGRNPAGFRSRISGLQEVVYMRLVLK